MNLEQIKETQQSLNHQLSKVLEELRTIVNFIAGEEVSVLSKTLDEKDIREYTNGILDKIALSQQENNELLNALNRQVDKLSDNIWQRESPPQCN